MKTPSIKPELASAESSSGIEAAIDNIRQAQKQVAAFARERAECQLSTGSLAAISRELGNIDRRLSVYVKD